MPSKNTKQAPLQDELPKPSSHVHFRALPRATEAELMTQAACSDCTLDLAGQAHCGK